MSTVRDLSNDGEVLADEGQRYGGSSGQRFALQPPCGDMLFASNPGRGGSAHEENFLR